MSELSLIAQTPSDTAQEVRGDVTEIQDFTYGGEHCTYIKTVCAATRVCFMKVGTGKTCEELAQEDSFNRPEIESFAPDEKDIAQAGLCAVAEVV